MEVADEAAWWRYSGTDDNQEHITWCFEVVLADTRALS
jgi:hypothetical protein